MITDFPAPYETPEAHGLVGMSLSALQGDEREAETANKELNVISGSRRILVSKTMK